jgi:crotonobetainyl-CoA:carnitine CoA-transferase CaiB-like acyl-CoA transferase
MQTWNLLKRNRTRTGERGMIPVPLPALGVYEAADGFVYLGILAPAGADLPVLVAWMAERGMAEDLGDEPYASAVGQLNMGFLTQVMANPANAAGLFAHLSHIHDVIGRFIASMPAVEAYEEGQRRNLLFGLVSTPEDLARNAQLRARDWFVPLEPDGAGTRIEFPGPPYRLGVTPASLGVPPRLGQHTAEVLRELTTGAQVS